MQCKNNLKQLALGCLNHENATGRFPTGGWGWGWTGDADRNNDWRQPGGWLYNILPYVEQQALHDAGLGSAVTAERRNAIAQSCMTPLTLMNCPTRRQAITYPDLYIGPPGSYRTTTIGSITTTLAARPDYAANASDTLPASPGWLPDNRGDPGMDPPPTYWRDSENMYRFTRYTGICYHRSEISMADVSDGTSNTYLVGEKYLNPDYYFTGQDWSDNENLLVGWDNDQYRLGQHYYGQDRAGYGGFGLEGFGSAHANGFQMAFCDGSVQMMNYTIDPETHRRLCNRKDGMVIDGKKF
ncbi:MAG: DUF1559 domain-containing protein [Planctomycetes bacterium]|nr:DUF1559 domain-containing protein [Planctomycetota bacterium]